MKVKFSLAFLAFVILFGLGSCKKQDDKTAILGIWQIYSQSINGVPVGDGKDWIEFKADGSCDTRPRTGGYESGNYTIDTENAKITLTGGNGSLDYNYFLTGDSLRLEAQMPNTGFPIIIKSVRTTKYPITADQEPIEDLNAPIMMDMNDSAVVPPPAEGK